MLAALREKESRRGTVQAEIDALHRDSAALSLRADYEGIEAELLARLDDWRGMLSADVGLARQMMRSLLDGRMVFTPDLDAQTCTFAGRGHLDGLLTGLIDPAALLVPMAMASPTGCARVGAPKTVIEGAVAA